MKKHSVVILFCVVLVSILTFAVAQTTDLLPKHHTPRTRVQKDSNRTKAQAAQATTATDATATACIYATKLHMELSADKLYYTLSFVSNENATESAELLLYPSTTKWISFQKGNAPTATHTIDLAPFGIEKPTKGTNTYNIPTSCLPEGEYTWAVKLTAASVTGMQNLNTLDQFTTATGEYVYNAVDRSPVSPYFGQVYAVHYQGRYKAAGNAIEQARKNGVRVYSLGADGNYVLDPNLYLGGDTHRLRNAKRPTVDKNGRVYLADAGTEHPGIFLFDPGNPTANFTSFFEGTLGEDYVKITDYTNKTVNIASDFYSLHINLAVSRPRLLAFTEKTLTDYTGAEASGPYGTVYYSLDMKYTSTSGGIRVDTDDDPTNDVNGIIKTWATRPTEAGTLKGGDKPKINNKNYDHPDNIGQSQLDKDGEEPMCGVTHEGVVWYTTKSGFFVAQSANDTDPRYTDPTVVPLQFYDTTTKQRFTSLNNSTIGTFKGGGFALTNDETKFVAFNYDHKFVVLNITWTPTYESDGTTVDYYTPSFSNKKTYASGLSSAKIRQMNFDYAGNLVVSGENGLIAMYSFPKADNSCVTPAAQTITIERSHDAIFFNTSGDGNWNNTANWAPQALPTATSSVLLTQSVTVDILEAQAANIDLHTVSGTAPSITIAAGNALYVAGTIKQVHDQALTTRVDLDATRFDYITLQANDQATSALAHHDTEGKTPATVQIHGYATSSPLQWQQIAVPFAQDDAATNFKYTYMYGWDDTQNDWKVIEAFNNPLHLFHGYLLSQPTPKTYTLTGLLQPSTEQVYTLHRNEDAIEENRGFNFLGNSWTAPLCVDKFVPTEDFFSSTEDAAIYLYDGGQYTAYPVTQDMAKGVVISPLQAFFVYTSTDGATISLKYDKLVTQGAQPASPLRVAQHTEEQTQTCLYLEVVGSEGDQDKLYLYQKETYSHAFDQGYEARKLTGDAGTPYLTATTPLGDMAVLATPALEGTFLKFRQGSSTTYTFTFTYNGDETLYLQDAIADKRVAIQTGVTYAFTTTEDDTQRFRIVRQIANDDVTTNESNVRVVDNNLFVENQTDEPMEVYVYSTDGKCVLQTVTREPITPLDVPMHGVYTIQVKTATSVQTIKQVL